MYFLNSSLLNNCSLKNVSNYTYCNCPLNKYIGESSNAICIPLVLDPRIALPMISTRATHGPSSCFSVSLMSDITFPDKLSCIVLVNTVYNALMVLVSCSLYNNLGECPTTYLITCKYSDPLLRFFLRTGNNSSIYSSRNLDRLDRT